MRISVVNFDESLATLDLLAGIRAVNVQIERDFAPYWHMHGQLRLDSADPRQSVEQLSGLKGDAIIYIVSRASPVHLGFHSRHANGTPFGFVFHQSDPARDAWPWTVALSHEALELIADPECNLFCKGPHPDPAEGGREVLHWFEVCDAVQDETYAIDGIEVSNFVLPLYFTGGEELDGRNDFLATKRGPKNRKLRSFSANPGGYVGFHDPLQPGRSQLWFADECAEHSWARKCEALPQVFRRADRRDKPHPLEVADVDPEAELAPPAVGVTIAAIHLRLGDQAAKADLHDELEQLLSATLGSSDYMVRRSEFERRDVEVFGPAIEQRTIAAAWDLVAELEAANKAWLDYADLVIVDHFAEAAAPELRAAGPVLKACACDRDPDAPATEPGDWALRRAGICDAWQKFADRRIPRERVGEPVLIGHPDTGYTNYLKQAGRIAMGGHDFLTRRSDGRDPLSPLTLHPGHGTRTGSVIVGPHDGLPGLCGVAPGAKLVPYRITTSVILGRGDLLADAINAAVERSCHVVSMSVGTALHPRRLQAAIDRAYQADVILVAAAGNCVNRLGGDDGFVVFPARNHRCIACAAVDHAGQLWCGSSNAGSVDVYAPGKSVWCVEPQRRGGTVPQRRRGTSFAAALVAGTAAMWLHWHDRAKLLELCEHQEFRLGDLFRATLSLCGQSPSFADRHARMLDAKAVLEVELDDAVAAAREDAAPFLERTLERLRGLFPRLPDADFDGRLADVLGIDRGAVLDVAAAHEAELELLLAHDHEVRAAMLGLDDPRRAATRGTLAERLPVSEGLRARLATA